MGTDGKVYFGCYDVDPVDVAVSTNALNDGSWHHVVGVRDDTANNLLLYVDGNLAATTPNSYAEAGNGYWRMGSYKLQNWTNAADGYFPGSIDEVRVSSSVRTQCWIQTEYNNQNWPNKFDSGVTGFVTVGGELLVGDVSLENHAAGQETDKFTTGSSVTGAELFAFRLINT